MLVIKKSDNKRAMSNNNNNDVKFENASSEIIDNEISILNHLNDILSDVIEALTRSKAVREKRKTNKK